jgi:carboxyl-terminal processing protease
MSTDHLLASLVQTLAPALVDAAVKGALLLVFAFAVSGALRRASASARHLVWSLTLLALLALPALSWMLPAWKLPIPLPGLEARARTANVWMVADDAGDFSPAPSPKDSPIAAQADAGGANARPGTLLVASRESLPSGTVPPPAGAVDAPVLPEKPAVAAVPWLWAVPLWLAGTGLCLAWTGLAWLWLARLRRRSQPVMRQDILALALQLANQLGIRRKIVLLQATGRIIPMTWGVLKPVILLPPTAVEWAPLRLRLVLTHELAHVHRLDCLTQLLAQLVRGLYWFNPLAWLVVARVRAEQEAACDDLVLLSGVEAPAYAEHLLAVTSGLKVPGLASPIALGITRAESLRRRLVKLLDSARDRRPVGRRGKSLALLCTLALLFPVAAADLAPTATAEDNQRSVVNPVVQAPADSAKDVDLAQLLAEVRKKLKEHYVAPFDEKKLQEEAIRGLLKGLKDPYTDFLSEQDLNQFQVQSKGVLTGIGVQLKLDEGRLTVRTPLEGSPALKAGMRPGDVIQTIDGKPAHGIEIQEAVNRIVGPDGTVVKLRVIHTDGAVQDLAVTRAQVTIPNLQGFRRGEDGRWRYLLDPVHKVGYVSVLSFASRTPDELGDIVKGLQREGLKGLILDLRSCPGGLLDSAVKVCDLFLDEGTILTTRSPGKGERTWKADAKDTLGDFPLVVLVNEQTASAAEIVAGALRDHKRAIILGTRTFGKGSVQTLVKLEGGGALRVTTAHHFLPSGRNIQKRPGEKTWGIDPSEGFYLPITKEQGEALQSDRQKRDMIGFTKEEMPKWLEPVTARVIETAHADPQLAAALRTLVARLTGGEFLKVGRPEGLAHDHALQLERMRALRESIMRSIERLDAEIAELQRAAAKEGKAPPK